MLPQEKKRTFQAAEAQQQSTKITRKSEQCYLGLNYALFQVPLKPYSCLVAFLQPLLPFVLLPPTVRFVKEGKRQ